MENINTLSRDKCCGCGACLNKCPVLAITMQENEEGFLYPVIDENKCIHCGLCAKTCPILNAKSNNLPNPKCYAVMADDDIRMKSSSGGMFTLLAYYVLNKNGYVCGAAFRKDWSVHHIIINTIADLDKLRGSKYVQSDTENCYNEIKTLLQQNKLVLFTGTPCQVAALKTFLGQDYEKLITCEILCHGTPSYKILRKYIDENYNINDIKRIEFRDKSLKWRSDYLTIEINNNIINKNIPECSFEKGFHAGLFNRKSCCPCKFAALPRQADFTIADWWGIDRVAPEMNDKLGTSLVLINNKNAKEIFAYLKNIKSIKEIPLEHAKKSVNHTIYRPLEHHFGRKIFFENIKNKSFDKAVDMAINSKYDVCLISIFYGLNYGSVLESYACNKIIKNLGYSVLMLNKPDFIWPNGPERRNPIVMNFANKHYNISRIYNSLEDLILLNNHVENFVVASDQMFNPVLNLSIAFLDFVKNQKNKISFATSFGHDEFKESPEITEKRKLSLHRFNHISLREKTPKLCDEIFNIQGEELIDPSLILSLDDLNELANSVTMDLQKKYLLTYILDLNPEKVSAIKYIAEKLNLEIINIQNLDSRQRKELGLEYTKDYTPEEFLHLYKNATFIVTDSYHGTCFSTKFNKQFISFMNKERGAMRYKMFSMLGLDERILSDSNMIYDNDIIYKDFNFTNTNKIIAEKSYFAINWLKNALENNTSNYSNIENYTDTALKDLAIQVHRLKQKEADLENYKLLFKKNKLFCIYFRYKFLSKLTWGKKRKHYKQKYKDMKPTIKKLRQLLAASPSF